MPDKSNNSLSFWQELKRRKVIRVIPVYAAASFVLLELVDIITEPFGLPGWTINFVLVLLCIGFIISIILSWVYDITPEGVKKTKSVTQVRSVEKQVTPRGWKISTYVSVLIIIAFVVFYIMSNIKQSSDISKLEKSIAVLPFDNMSVDEEYSHMGDAITDEIILELQKIKEFDRVISRTSTMQYKDNRPTIPEIAEKLGVNYIIEGSIQRHKEDVSIRVQVIRAKHEDHVWANEYDGKWEDIFSIQDEIALKVANELKTVLSPEEIEQIEKNPTENLDAYNLYLKGRYHWHTRKSEDIIKAIDFFKQAIERDSNYAAAYTGLADCYGIQPSYQRLLPHEAYPKARKAVMKALELDNGLAEAYTSLAAVKYNYDRAWSDAEKLFKKSISLNPNYATAHQWYSELLSTLGRHDEAIREIKHAVELDPLSPIITMWQGSALYFARDYNQAILFFHKAIKLYPNFWHTYGWLGSAYLQIEEYELAIEAFLNQKKYSNNSTGALISLGNAYALSGRRTESLQILDELLNLPDQKVAINAVGMANFFISLSDIDRAFYWLSRAYKQNDWALLFVNVNPAFDLVRSDPRFIELVKKMSFE